MCIHKQTNYLNNYLILINSICEFVCGFCGHKRKEKRKRKKKHGPVYRVDAQLKTSITEVCFTVAVPAVVQGELRGGRLVVCYNLFA